MSTRDAKGERAVRAALADIDHTAIQHAYAGDVYGGSTSGQTAFYRAGITGIPVVNVNDKCTTGSSELFVARQAVEHGLASDLQLTSRTKT
jgi:sterol carrier protein 2